MNYPSYRFHVQLSKDGCIQTDVVQVVRPASILYAINEKIFYLHKHCFLLNLIASILFKLVYEFKIDPEIKANIEDFLKGIGMFAWLIDIKSGFRKFPKPGNLDDIRKFRVRLANYSKMVLEEQQRLLAELQFIGTKIEELRRDAEKFLPLIDKVGK